MRLRLYDALPRPPLLPLVAGAALLGLAACGLGRPLEKPDRSAAQCAKIQERNTKCWKEMGKRFNTALLIRGLRKIKAAPKDQRKKLLAAQKAALAKRLEEIRATLVDGFIPLCKKDWHSSKPAHRRMKKQMLTCLTRPDCKEYAKCFSAVHAK